MTARSKINAGDAAVEVLSRAGVRRFYTVPGESFLEVMDAVERHPELSLVSTRHESGAAFMAEADAKLTGAPAVAMATRGVGASNLAIGVHTARQDSTPMLVLHECGVSGNRPDGCNHPGRAHGGKMRSSDQPRQGLAA